MKLAAGVDDDRLAGHGLGTAHRDHHIAGAVILAGGLFKNDVAAAFSICSRPSRQAEFHPTLGRRSPCGTSQTSRERVERLLLAILAADVAGRAQLARKNG
jgi:hypothetical protein